MDLSKVLGLIILGFVPFIHADPIVIAHRGASGYLPEHTLAAYERAIDQGADYIEPDLVITRDGEVVARHDIYLSTTTTVAQVPAFRSRKKRIGDRLDWYVEDFTLAEIKSLKARQAFPGRSGEYDGRFDIPTFQEVIDLVQRKQIETGRKIGIYPETKAPSHFESLGFDFAELLIAVLEKNNLNELGKPVLIQSFEPEILKRLSGMTQLPLVMLVRPASPDALHTPNIELDQIARFADGIGAMKPLLMDVHGESTGLIERAHELGLFVHAWTFRDDAYPAEIFDSAKHEVRHFLAIGIDGFFTDFPDSGVKVRDQFVEANRIGR
ncbi:MAG: glycerophosphodiester phosphodiesterase family protein [Pseudomonadales bacterium]